MADILDFADAKLIKENPYFAQLHYAADRLNKSDAQFDIANFFYDGEHIPKDIQRAAGWYRRAAENGHVRARFFLGVIYLMGVAGIDKNGGEAHKWLSMAAEDGYVPAQYNLGIMLATGDGVNADLDAAKSWLARAAENGYKDANSALSKL